MLALDYFNYKTPLRPSPLPLPNLRCIFPLLYQRNFFALQNISAKKLVNIREGAELQFT